MMTQEEIDTAFVDLVKPEFERLYAEYGEDMSKSMFFMFSGVDEVEAFKNEWLNIVLGIQDAGLIAPEIVEGMKVTEET